jgi:predicted AlkP superfamily pyrophosphatase or phosphodiesterase
MKIVHFLSAVLLLLLGSALAAEVNRHVVLISVDGFPAAMMKDPKTPIPRIRELAAEGVVAEGMRVSTPSVTWPNHTTLVTGVHPDKHSVLYNGILTRKGPDEPVAVDPKKTKAELVAVPTIYDILHAKRLRTSGINWPATRAAKTIHDDFPDVPDTLQHSTPLLIQEMVSAGVLPSSKDADFRAMTGPARDEVWTEAACHVILRRKPNFMMFHLLNTDGVHHKYGPQTPASYTAMALADVHVGRIVDALDQAGIRKQTTIIVTSDHGFATITNVLYPNAIFRKEGLLETGGSNQVTKARVQLVSEGGIGMIYLNNPATRDADRKRVFELLKGKPCVQEILTPEQFAEYGLPSPTVNQGMADLVLVAADGYGISGAVKGDELVVPAGVQDNLGYHGYVGTNPKMNAAFIISGAGIKRGHRIGLIENIDVAPTIAKIFSAEIPGARGKPINEVFE